MACKKKIALRDILLHSRLVQLYCPLKEIPSVGPYLHQHKSSISSKPSSSWARLPALLHPGCYIMLPTIIRIKQAPSTTHRIGPSTQPPQAPWYLFFIVFRRSKFFTVEPVDFQDPLVALHETLTEISDWLTVGSSTQFQPAFHRAHCCTTNLSSPLNPKRSWLAVDVTFNTPSATPSHAQPLPKRLNATLEKALQI